MIRLLILNSLIAITFVLFFMLNQWAFQHFIVTESISWIFLPAGLRLFFVLVYRWSALPGIFIGSFVAALINSPNESYIFVVCLALASTLNPLIALLIVERTSKYLTLSLENINLRVIMSLAIVQAFFCSTLHHLIFIAYEKSVQEYLFYDLISMFVGDLIGIALLMTGCVFFFKLVLLRYKH
ncbi:MAG: hypothetical protein JXQ86_04095 [Methylophilaceae bacterium]